VRILFRQKDFDVQEEPGITVNLGPARGIPPSKSALFNPRCTNLILYGIDDTRTRPWKVKVNNKVVNIV
jgi:hypothetical protein